jgi:aminoglycoside 3-N-acetyltransferase
VGHGSNTSLHLAEYLADYGGKSYVDCFAPTARDGSREWTRYRDIDLDSDDFGDIGAAFEKAGGVEFGAVGNAAARLMKQRDLVDFGVQWMQEHREPRS